LDVSFIRTGKIRPHAPIFLFLKSTAPLFLRSISELRVLISKVHVLVAYADDIDTFLSYQCGKHI